MIYINPFEELMTFVPSIALQGFVVAMILMVAICTIVDMACHLYTSDADDD